MDGTLKRAVALAVVLSAAGAITAAALKTQAEQVVAETPIAGMYAWQQSHGRPFDPMLTAAIENAQGNIAVAPGSVVSYRVSADREHYVFAVQVGHHILVGSDSHRGAVACTDYMARCLSQVTRDSRLLVAPALWFVPVGRRQVKASDYLPPDSPVPGWALDLLDNVV